MRKLLKFLFHHFYHSFAWSYDFVAALVSVGRWADWRRATLAYLPAGRVLEIGFGTGHLQVQLGQRGWLALGMDESAQMTAITRRRLIKNNLPVRLARGCAQFLPFASNSLDGLLATFPSEYILDTRSLAEFLRVLKPSGRLVVVPTAWIGGKKFWDRAAAWLFRITGQTVPISAALEDRIQAIFTQAGFQPEIFRAEVRGSIVLIVNAQKSG